MSRDDLASLSRAACVMSTQPKKIVAYATYLPWSEAERRCVIESLLIILRRLSRDLREQGLTNCRREPRSRS